MDKKVTEELSKYVEEKFRGPDPPKSRPQKDMDPAQCTKVIQAMLAKSGLYVGVGPISKDHIDEISQSAYSEKNGNFFGDFEPLFWQLLKCYNKN